MQVLTDYDEAGTELPLNAKTLSLSLSLQTIFSKPLITFYGSSLSLLQFINAFPKLWETKL